MTQVMSGKRGLGGARKTGISANDRAPFGWAPFVVLFLVGLVDRVEHSLMSGVLPIIQAEWKFSDTLAGSIPTAGAVAAAIVALPAGYMADRFSRTRIIAIVVFIWALATMGSGLAAGFAMFYMMRVVLAAAENIDNPASSSLLADYYPPVNRPKVFGWVRITTYLGGLGTMAGGVLGQALGWRSAFMVMVIPGIIVAIIAWFLREPPRGLLDRIVAGGSTDPVPVPTSANGSGASPNGQAGKPAGLAARLPNRQFWPQLKSVLRIPTLLLVSIALAVHTVGVAGVFFWLPSLMVRNFDQSPAAAASLSGLITVVGVVAGTALGSFLGPRMHARFKGGLLMTGGGGIAIGASVLFLSLRMPTVGAYTAVLMVSCMLMSVAIPTCTAAIADTIGAKSRGIGFALVQFLLTVGTSVGPLTVGILSDSTGSLLTAISMLITPMVIGGLCTVFLGRRFYDRDAARVMAEARDEPA